MGSFRISLGSYAQYNQDLFAGLSVPDNVDKDILVATILDEYGNFEMARSLEQMPASITLWGKRNQYMMRQTMQTTLERYALLENTDKHSEISDTTKTTSSGTAQNKVNGATSGSSTDTMDKAAYTGEALKTDAKNTNSGNSKSETSSNGSTTGTSSVTYTHTEHTHGNIGVTTSQQMLQEERECAEFDAYKAIAKSFALALLVPIFRFN